MSDIFLSNFDITATIEIQKMSSNDLQHLNDLDWSKVLGNR